MYRFQSNGKALIVRMVLVIALIAFCYGNPQDDIVNCRPEQVRLSYGKTTKDVIVVWATIGQCSAKVNHGTDPMQLTDVTPGESIRFADPWNPKGLQFLHRVPLRNLPADTVIGYQPQSNSYPLGTIFFRTPQDYKPPPVHLKSWDEIPDTEQKDGEWSFMVLGDLPSASLLFPSINRQLKKHRYAAILHPGDMAFNLSSDGGKTGDLYFKLFESSLSQTPYLTTPGPSSRDNDTYSHYLRRLSLPSSTNWPMTIDQMWYSIDIGPIHVISYSTEVYQGQQKYAQAQHTWLIEDLTRAKANRKNVPWIVAFGNQPMYCTSEDPSQMCNQNIIQGTKELEDLMYTYGVELVISSSPNGNMASYPMYKGVKLGDDHEKPFGPTHISIAAGTRWTSKYNTSEEEWVSYQDDDKTPLTFGRLSVHNSSRLHYEIVAFEGDRVLHSFHIDVNEHQGFSKDQLPVNLTLKIDEQIKLAGGDPNKPNIQEATTPKPTNTVNTITKKIKEIIFKGDNKSKIIIGASIGGVILFLIVVVLVMRRVCRGRRRQSARRWETMDINYGKKYYNKAPDKDELDQDFEIDMTETTQSRKLLSDD